MRPRNLVVVAVLITAALGGGKFILPHKVLPTLLSFIIPKYKDSKKCWRYDKAHGIECACNRECSKSAMTLDELYEAAEEMQKNYSGRMEVLDDSADLLCRAICINSHFGPAYAGISNIIQIEGMRRGGNWGYDPEMYKMARWWLDRARELSPNDDRYIITEWGYLDVTRKTHEECQRARELLQKAIDTNPNVASYYRYRSRPNYRKSYEGAIADLNTAVKLAKTDIERSKDYWELADLREERGEYREWEEAWRKAIQYAPDNAWFRSSFAWRLADIGRCKEAKETLEDALRLMDFGMAHKNLADAEECLRTQRKYGTPPPEFSEAIFMMKAKRKKETLGLLQKATEAKPYNPYMSILYVLVVSDINNFSKITDPDVYVVANQQLKIILQETGEGCEAKYLRDYIKLRKASHPKATPSRPPGERPLFNECDYSYMFRYSRCDLPPF